jgi:UDP-glucose 4-epimerase
VPVSPPSPPIACLTGGAGFIGSHLADAFVAGGFRVVVVDDLSGGRPENVPAGAELEVLDVRSAAAARRVEGLGARLLVHQAAQIDVGRSVLDPLTDADVNVKGTLNLLEAARRGGVRQVLFASTGGAMYGDQEVYPAPEEHPARPVSPYGVGKLAGERYLYYYHRQWGLDACCLRYANVYGERQNPHGEAGVVAIFLDRLLAGAAPTINGDGLQTRDYVHVSDVVAANLAAVGRPGFHVYNVGTGRETTVVEVYRTLAAALGTDRAAVHGPPRPGEQRRSSIDPARARRELGIAPPLPLDEGLRRTAAWFRAARAAGAAVGGGRRGGLAVAGAAGDRDQAGERAPGG